MRGEARMSWNDAQYFRGRADCERDLAASCDNPVVAQVHLEMAHRYEQMIKKRGRSTLKLVTTRGSADGAQAAAKI
jgi:hypothetical protein